MDDVSFHSDTNTQKWKFVILRWTTPEQKLDEKALNCKKIMKVNMLVKIVTDDGLSCENLGNEWRKVYDRGQCVKLSFSTLN